MTRLYNIIYYFRKQRQRRCHRLPAAMRVVVSYLFKKKCFHPILQLVENQLSVQSKKSLCTIERMQLSQHPQNARTHTPSSLIHTRYIDCKILYYYLKDISGFECSVYTKFSTPLCTSTYNNGEEEEKQIDGADDGKKKSYNII